MKGRVVGPLITLDTSFQKSAQYRTTKTTTTHESNNTLTLSTVERLVFRELLILSLTATVFFHFFLSFFLKNMGPEI